MLRRIIDCAHNDDSTQLHIVFCDWAKVFDRIKPKALMIALERFGITGKTLELIQTVYENRTFCISDGSEKSSKRQQSSGIAQGCPLSPYLFIILMTVLFEDVENALASKDIQITVPDYV